MKTASIAQRGRNAAGVDMVRIRCPVCDGSHWLRANEPIVRCPRRGARHHCAECGRRIGKGGGHYIVAHRVLCVRCIDRAP